MSFFNVSIITKVSLQISIYELNFSVSSMDSLLYPQLDGFMKTVPSGYTLLRNSVYLSHRTQVSEGTDFKKHFVVCRVTFNLLLQGLKIAPCF